MKNLNLLNAYRTTTYLETLNPEQRRRGLFINRLARFTDRLTCITEPTPKITSRRSFFR